METETFAKLCAHLLGEQAFEQHDARVGLGSVCVTVARVMAPVDAYESAFGEAPWAGRVREGERTWAVAAAEKPGASKRSTPAPRLSVPGVNDDTALQAPRRVRCPLVVIRRQCRHVYSAQGIIRISVGEVAGGRRRGSTRLIR